MKISASPIVINAIAASILTFGMVSCAEAPPQVVSLAPQRLAVNSIQACGQRAARSAAEVDACVQRDSLWSHLSQFQRIADEHRDGQGHGNRDTGTPGYEASVDYVAGLMQKAGYHVSVQAYQVNAIEPSRDSEFGFADRPFAVGRDWYVARGSALGSVEARVATPRTADGCGAGDFADFRRGDIALLASGACGAERQVGDAERAGAVAVVLIADRDAFAARLRQAASIPVVGYVSHSLAATIQRLSASSPERMVRLDIRGQRRSVVDYNLIAESPYGDPDHVVVADAHLDSIFGAGMLDNASGSTSLLETALALAKTPTKNRLRYIWFGGEELGLLGSHYYTTHLTATQLRRIVFDIDVDVTATPNFDIQIADPAYASDEQQFPKDVVPLSKVGNDAFYDFFRAGGIMSRAAPFGNDGTDSNSFALVGVPDTGVLTEQDCCKQQWEVALWGGYLGDYEGKVPGFTGGCADQPDRWCDNLSNNDPFVLTLVSKAVARVVFGLANDPKLGRP